MSNKMFLVEFDGGPKDGLRVEVGFVPARTLFASPIRSSPTDASVGRRNPPLAKYEIERTRFRRDSTGLPAIEVRYRFAGMESRFDSLGDRIVSRLSRILRLPRDHWMSQCRAKIAAWMLTPVDYPLKTTHLVSNFASNDAKLVG